MVIDREEGEEEEKRKKELFLLAELWQGNDEVCVCAETEINEEQDKVK